MNNSKHYATPATKQWLLVILALLPWLSGCAQTGQLPKPPISLPFEIQKAGSRVEMDIRIVSAIEYRFSLLYLYNQNDPLDIQRVRKLAGYANLDKPGVPVLLRLNIRLVDSTGKKLILEQDVSDIRVVAAGAGSYTKKIIYLNLAPGHYRVSIESLKDVPELIGTPVEFLIAFNPKP